jgi:hypothetical protein
MQNTSSLSVSSADLFVAGRSGHAKDGVIVGAVIKIIIR